MLILPPTSALYQTFSDLVKSKRFIFVAGIPGVGKSLYVQQLALLAQRAGRAVHLFQYDVARMAFEGSEIGRTKYPEIEGVTQPMMRKAVGHWAREGVCTWYETYADPAHILIGEVPLVGNRLIELVQPIDDQLEPLLSGEMAQFLVPVPSKAIRKKIEASRAASIANPRNAKEFKDAQPQVLQQNWRDVQMLGHLLGAGDAYAGAGIPPYEPAVYSAVFRHLLQHRPAEILEIDIDLKPSGSVYDLDGIISEPAASPEEVARIIAEVEARYTLETAAAAVETWYNV